LSLQLINITREPDDQIVNILRNDPIGTPGKSIVYSHKNVENKLRDIPDPYFANLYLRKYLLATVCFSRREVNEDGTRFSAFYIRYFYFRDKFRSTAKEKQQRKEKNSLLRTEINKLLDGSGLPTEHPAIFYAYVDPGNIRSTRLIDQFGLIRRGRFSALIFSRLFPKDSSLVQKESISQNPQIIELLYDFYRDYHLLTLDNLIRYDNYYVLRENGEVICGVQAVLENWRIHEIPGFAGKIIMNIVPYIPVIKRLFNPEYKFVYLDGLICKTGYEKKLEILLSAILRRYKVYSGIICADKSSGLYRLLRSMKLGIINSMQDEIEMEALVKPIKGNLPISEGPIYISGIDVM